jgi:hypothetical protein
VFAFGNNIFAYLIIIEIIERGSLNNEKVIVRRKQLK